MSYAKVNCCMVLYWVSDAGLLQLISQYQDAFASLDDNKYVASCQQV